jgi:hypothetical protein
LPDVQVRLAIHTLPVEVESEDLMVLISDLDLMIKVGSDA